ncbi:cdc42 effector protein 4-like [Lates japonicus]
MPILKQLVSGSSQTKRRSRMDLTREMISAPLGDFRHTMHVGRSGDAFGDTSFLSTRSGEPPPRGHILSPLPTAWPPVSYLQEQQTLPVGDQGGSAEHPGGPRWVTYLREERHVSAFPQ